jgi:hypothetical protein
MLARADDGVDRGEPRCFAARRNAEFCSHPAEKLGRKVMSSLCNLRSAEIGCEAYSIVVGLMCRP